MIFLPPATSIPDIGSNLPIKTRVHNTHKSGKNQ
jgi:hypothetical protein